VHRHTSIEKICFSFEQTVKGAPNGSETKLRDAVDELHGLLLQGLRRRGALLYAGGVLLRRMGVIVAPARSAEAVPWSKRSTLVATRVGGRLLQPLRVWVGGVSLF
jgi:hypothetical protein